MEASLELMRRSLRKNLRVKLASLTCGSLLQSGEISKVMYRNQDVETGMCILGGVFISEPLQTIYLAFFLISRTSENRNQSNGCTYGFGLLKRQKNLNQKLLVYLNFVLVFERARGSVGQSVGVGHVLRRNA